MFIALEIRINKSNPKILEFTGIDDTTGLRLFTYLSCNYDYQITRIVSKGYLITRIHTTI